MREVTDLKDRHQYFASDDLLEELKEKMKEDDQIVNFAFTDYGGDFFDNVCCDFFAEKYPENFVCENTSWSGKNAFLFGDVAKEFLEVTHNYLLGFEDLEEYYSDKQYEAEEKGYRYFVEYDLKNEYEFDEEEVMSFLLNEMCGYYSITSGGDLDYSYSDLIKRLLKNGIITKLTDDESEEE